MEYKLEEKEAQCRCLQCGNAIDYSGRPDRKFCSNGCKNRYHNYRRFHRRDLTERNILNILDRNHHVLDGLLKMNVRSLDRISLTYMGFNPEYATSFCQTGRRVVYTCFDIRYELTPTRIRKIALLDLSAK